MMNQRLTREITIVRRFQNGVNKYGNATFASTSTVCLCRREAITTSENTQDRAQQLEQYRYFVAGEIAVNGNDEISDGSDTLKVLGNSQAFCNSLGKVDYSMFLAEKVLG
jgi:hypothetical protein